MASTAVHAPVTAVVEYNYERDGAVLIPAGTRVVGKITQADPSGFVNITFSSIEFPEGGSEEIDAVAADMGLQAIKGKVTGKKSGKSLLVRSLSGLGETAAMIVGAPSANSAFSEDDLLRMRVADNIGNASDQQIMQMMTMQHIVVSVAAGTEIYVIFEKAQRPTQQTRKRRFTYPVLTIPPTIPARRLNHSEPISIRLESVQPDHWANSPKLILCPRKSHLLTARDFAVR